MIDVSRETEGKETLDQNAERKRETETLADANTLHKILGGP